MEFTSCYMLCHGFTMLQAVLGTCSILFGRYRVLNGFKRVLNRLFSSDMRLP